MTWRARWSNMNPYDIHKMFINEYILTKKGSTSLLTRDTSQDKRDVDVIRENHKFLWDEETDTVDSWEKKIAKKYYDKLYKEYCVGDLSRYKEDKFGFRWRTEKELIEGKGQFSCGEKRCNEERKLRTWEVNFEYMEQGVKKNALVKLRLCPHCSKKLNYRFQRKEAKRKLGRLQKRCLEPSSPTLQSLNDDESVPKLDSSEQVTVPTDAWKYETNHHGENEKVEDDAIDEFLQDLFL